jgi:hypothetical protein
MNPADAPKMELALNKSGVSIASILMCEMTEEKFCEWLDERLSPSTSFQVTFMRTPLIAQLEFYPLQRRWTTLGWQWWWELRCLFWDIPTIKGPEVAAVAAIPADIP